MSVGMYLVLHYYTTHSLSVTGVVLLMIVLKTYRSALLLVYY